MKEKKSNPYKEALTRLIVDVFEKSGNKKCADRPAVRATGNSSMIMTDRRLENKNHLCSAGALCQYFTRRGL